MSIVEMNEEKEKQGEEKENRIVVTKKNLADIIQELKKEEIIAIDCEGVDLSRKGLLTNIQIATEKKRAFCFDMLSEDSDDFSKELKPIFENEKILKVLHDCREDGDALFHQLKITLKNVHDTQICHMIITSAEKRSNLKELKDFYKIKDEATKEKAFYFNGGHMKDPFYWKKRPMTDEMLKIIYEDVENLIPLKILQSKTIQSKNLEKIIKEETDKSLNLMNASFEKQIHVTNIGKFIGTKGSHLFFLEKKFNCVISGIGNKTGDFFIRCFDKESLDKVVNDALSDKK